MLPKKKHFEQNFSKVRQSYAHYVSAQQKILYFKGDSLV